MSKIFSSFFSISSFNFSFFCLHFLFIHSTFSSLLMSQKNKITWRKIDHTLLKAHTSLMTTWDHQSVVHTRFWSFCEEKPEIDYKNFSLQLSFEPTAMDNIHRLQNFVFCYSCFIFTMTDLNDDTWYVKTAFHCVPWNNLSINFLVSIWQKIDKCRIVRITYYKLGFGKRIGMK